MGNLNKIIMYFIRIHNPNDRLLQQYNLDGHTVREVDPHAPKIRNDRDNNVPVGFVTPNLVVGQYFMFRVRDDMADQMWATY